MKTESFRNIAFHFPIVASMDDYLILMGQTKFILNRSSANMYTYIYIIQCGITVAVFRE
jgi:hypothetical protein